MAVCERWDAPVLLATLGQTDVTDLLLVGIVPGLVLAVMYGVLIWGWTVIDPSAAPYYEVAPIPLSEKLKLIVFDVLPMVGLIVLSVVLMLVGWGVIFGGIFFAFALLLSAAGLTARPAVRESVPGYLFAASTIGLAVDAGMAKPMPIEPPLGE